MTDIPTSDAEIISACPGISVWLYRDLAKLKKLPQLPIAVLYETEPGFGHWVGVMATPEGIEHFDSYGLRPDDELKWVPARYRSAFAAGSPHMVRLLLADGRDVNYNEFELQGGGAIATCGRWVVTRCRNSHLTTRQFASAVTATAAKLNMTPDALTTILMPPAAS